MTPSSPSSEVRAILLDIEGTVTPISFVHEVLFPFARAHAREFLEEQYPDPEVQRDLAMLYEEHKVDCQTNKRPPPLIHGPEGVRIESLVGYMNWLIDLDRKSPGLKSLQGKIWKQGYEDGSLKAPLFPDVLPAVKRWHTKGISINIFSSGSVLAQQLLFAHTQMGDLTPYISRYFDTAVGKKTDFESYQRIVAGLGIAADVVLFISDVVAELDAARDAMMKSLLCIRPGNAPQPSHAGHSEIQTFQEIC